jgi:hypothetical protein
MSIMPSVTKGKETFRIKKKFSDRYCTRDKDAKRCETAIAQEKIPVRIDQDIRSLIKWCAQEIKDLTGRIFQEVHIKCSGEECLAGDVFDDVSCPAAE